MTAPAKSRSWPLDRAVASIIEGDTGVGGLLDPAGPLLATPPVWSGFAPDGAVLDYIVIGNGSEVESAGTPFGGWAFENTLDLHVWTRDRSRKTASLILGRLLTLLHRRPIVLLDDADVVLGTVAGPFAILTVLPDPSGETAHGVGRLAIESYQR